MENGEVAEEEEKLTEASAIAPSSQTLFDVSIRDCNWFFCMRYDARASAPLIPIQLLG